MRWPFGRIGRQAAAGPDERDRDMAATAAIAVPQHRSRGWTRVPPLETTVTLRPPILHTGLLSLPPVSGTQPLLRQEISMIVALPMAEDGADVPRLRLESETGGRPSRALPHGRAPEPSDQPHNDPQPA